MAKVLFIHSPNMHESHRMFAEALYTPLRVVKPLGEDASRKRQKQIFELAYPKTKSFQEICRSIQKSEGVSRLSCLRA